MNKNRKDETILAILVLLIPALFLAAVIGLSFYMRAQDKLESDIGQVTVSWEYPHNSLVNISRHYFPNFDYREVVYEITLLNPGINAGRLQIGQIIKMP